MAQQQPPNDAEGPTPGNYRELYSAVGFQAGKPAVDRLLSSYRFTEVAGGGERPTPASLREQTFAFSDRRPMSFLCLARTTGARLEIRVLHWMMCYFESPGGGGGGVVDLSMGFLGDVRAAQFPVVEVDNTIFTLVGGTGARVPTMAVMMDHLDAAPPGLFLGPFTNDVADTELIRSVSVDSSPAHQVRGHPGTSRRRVACDSVSRTTQSVHCGRRVESLRGRTRVAQRSLYRSRRIRRAGRRASGGSIGPPVSLARRGQRLRGGQGLEQSPGAPWSARGSYCPYHGPNDRRSSATSRECRRRWGTRT